MAKSRGSEFTDKLKADIYVRDRATCAFSGKSLWVLDYGLSPHWDWDWVDHIKPASKGGKAIIENGICASSTFNSKKSNNGRDNLFFFESGSPTNSFFMVYEKIPREIQNNLKRFANLHHSDWYLNRGIAHFMFILNYYYERSKKVKKIRDDVYYSKVALKKIEKWRRIVSSENLPTLEKRSILTTPFSNDQMELLKLREMQNIESIIALAKRLYPFYRANFKAIDLFFNTETKSEAIKLLNTIRKSKFISTRVFDNIQHNIKAKYGKI